eukprot:GHRQ01036080.1.p2 GENE.GHRQ01036080.1~~GHRQ01036080.1.p2  ORF type:complete len:111 (+),score=46.54 GHRQ01036080.1:170-502(+)
MKTLEAAMDDLQRKNLIPLQKESFLCAAKCCDKHSDMQALQQCTVNCQAKVQSAHQVLYGNLEDFQKRFQRCLMRCQDQAKVGRQVYSCCSQAGISAIHLLLLTQMFVVQ